MDGLKILFVDDEKAILKSLKRLFRGTGFVILTAENGREALDLLASERVQIVVSDYRMPEMNGVEFLHSVKSIYPDTVRMILSGFADTQAVLDAINRGEVYRFLTKPWDDAALLQIVRECADRFFSAQTPVALQALEVAT